MAKRYRKLALQLLKSREDQKAKDLLAGLFPQQLAFATDKADLAVAVCSRQAGKTHTAAITMLQQATIAGSSIAYIALTRKSAKAIMWTRLKSLARDYGIQCTSNEADLILSIDNGSIIYLVGANDVNCAETLRGPSWDLVFLDEAASYRDIAYLCEEIIQPSFITKLGRLRIIGTPSPDFSSYFYTASHNPEWSKHHWETVDNIHIPHAAEYIQQIKKKKGYSNTHPIYLREWRGIWSRSSDEMVYEYERDRNTSVLPTSLFSQLREVIGQWNYIFGIDFGFNDSNAIVVLAYNANDFDVVYVVEEFKATRQTLSDFAAVLLRLVEKYKPGYMVADGGGLGKTLIEELNQRYNVYIQPAQKLGKLANTAIINDAFRTSKFQLTDSCPQLAKELENLTYLEGTTKENPNCENHLSDAMNYSYTFCYGYMYREPEPEQDIANVFDLHDDNEVPESEEWWE